MEKQAVKIIECPRDAMQGIKTFIPTSKKVEYIQQLLQVGFDTIDFGSFVSPKAIPQLKDTAEVLTQLNLSETKSKLLAIVANKRGAEDAAAFEQIDYLGYPFSISETFQQRNTNASIEESMHRVEQIQNLCLKANKQLIIYISMAFGNPYGDSYHEDIVAEWLAKLANLDVKTFALSDTIGVAKKEIIAKLFNLLIPAYPQLEIGAHFHTTPESWKEKIETAFEYGCRRFDGAIKGFGGCPMASDELTGNMPTEHMVAYFSEHYKTAVVDNEQFDKAILLASKVFPM